MNRINPPNQSLESLKHNMDSMTRAASKRTKFYIIVALIFIPVFIVGFWLMLFNYKTHDELEVLVHDYVTENIIEDIAVDDGLIQAYQPQKFDLVLSNVEAKRGRRTPRSYIVVFTNPSHEFYLFGVFEVHRNILQQEQVHLVYTTYTAREIDEKYSYLLGAAEALFEEGYYNDGKDTPDN